jgi:hypothetical protein
VETVQNAHTMSHHGLFHHGLIRCPAWPASVSVSLTEVCYGTVKKLLASSYPSCCHQLSNPFYVLCYSIQLSIISHSNETEFSVLLRGCLNLLFYISDYFILCSTKNCLQGLEP